MKIFELLLRPSILAIFMLSLIVVVTAFSLFPTCDGDKVWSNHTGIFEYIDVDCDTCCHFRTWIKLENKSKIWTVDGNEDLEDIFTPGETYTFYLKPFPEPYAVTRGMWEHSCYWDQVIDYVEDEQGNVVYGWKLL